MCSVSSLALLFVHRNITKKCSNKRKKENSHGKSLKLKKRTSHESPLVILLGNNGGVFVKEYALF